VSIRVRAVVLRSKGTLAGKLGFYRVDLRVEGKTDGPSEFSFIFFAKSVLYRLPVILKSNALKFVRHHRQARGKHRSLGTVHSFKQRNTSAGRCVGGEAPVSAALLVHVVVLRTSSNSLHGGVLQLPVVPTRSELIPLA
jgi:hypothetical protein